MASKIDIIMGRLDIARVCERQERWMTEPRKPLLSKAPEGTAVLFFIQIVSTLGFAVLYSTLVRFSPKPIRRLP